MPTSACRPAILFALFFVSGFCGLLYQIVWMRLAFASFGIISPVISVVISVFMLGLALGSWLAGRFVAPLTRSTKLSAIVFYAGAEFLIGIGAFAVPGLFAIGETSLLHMGESNSFPYLVLSAAAIALSLFPWCVCMGTTFPLMMAYMKEVDCTDARSFSFLYTANVFGAMFGTLLTATVLVELLGFQHTLWVAGVANLTIAGVSLVLGLRPASRPVASETKDVAAPVARPASPIPFTRTILFTTGFSSMGMEVVWNRAFTPVLGTQVYSFAALLGVYLIGTWMGVRDYRRDLRLGRIRPVGQSLAVLAIVVFLPVVLNDPRLFDHLAVRACVALVSILPMCSVLGYLTPCLIDEHSSGNPGLAGSAYAVNVLGCILGPLFASYALLPFVGANYSLVILATPFLLFHLIHRRTHSVRRLWGVGMAAGLLLFCSVALNVSYEDARDPTADKWEVRRDYAATVISKGKGPEKLLIVNGMGMTMLTPICKYMVHLPLAHQRHRPESGLAICFGMGTVHRSLLSWDLRTTSIELIPSVKEAFPFYHADAEAILRHPKGRIVIDDGRRYLNRTNESFDVIVVDPPPPIQAAGSSLLYSVEFHTAVKRHLKPGGIFQTWLPCDLPADHRVAEAVARSVREVFPHVKAYRSVEGRGIHFLASMSPLESVTPEEMLRCLPVAAQQDLTEWSRQDLKTDIEKVLSSEFPVADLLSENESVKITDDSPYNEYYLLREGLGIEIYSELEDSRPVPSRGSPASGP